jgi:hypothetical protein
MGENTIITAQHTFAVLDSVMRMELLTKTPILSFQSRGVFVLRLYNRNNSYTVIDPRKITWSTSSPELRIDPQGVVTPTERSIKDGKITPYTVYGDYLGQRVSASIAISPTNTINGSQAQLSHIVINAEWGKCNTATQAPGCDRIVASGSMSRIGELQAIAYYSDGRTRDITRYATWSTSHPYMAKLLKASSKFDLRFGPESRPGDVVKLTAVYEGQQASHLITVLPVKDIVLAEPQLGATLEVDTSRKVLLPQPRIQAVDESGASGTVWGEVKKPLLWSSTDPRVLAAISGLNVPSSHNQDFLIDTSKLPPGNSYPISLTYTYEGYGLSKVLRGEYVLKNVEVQPVGLKLEVGYSEPRVSFRESVQSLTCYLEYPNRSPVDIPCSEVNLTFTLGENSSSATNITPEVYLGISDTRPLPRFISRRFRPTDFLIPTPENSDRVFTVQGTHKTLNFKSAPVSGYIFGIDRLAPETPPAALPTEEPLKADDPFCTEERRNLAPVAGGTGRPSDPFVVCTAQQLMNVSQAKRTGTGSGSVVSLRANLDFAGVSGLTPIKLNASTMSELGDVTLLLGNGYRISNITIIDRERDKVGIFAESIDVRDLIIDRAVVRGDTTVGILFGESGGEVVNVQILRSTVQGTSKVGAIAGAATRTHVKRVFIKDSQIAFEQGYAGCIFGTSSTRNFFGKLSGSIVDSVCTSTTINPVGVQGTQEAIGGLVGKFSGDEYLPDFLSPRGGKEIPITPSSAWLSKPNVHISNSHFSGTINAGLKAGSTGIGQSEVGGLVGVGVEVGIVQSSAKADITSIGSNVGGLVGSFDCESRDGGFGFLIGSSFEGSITGGQAVGGPSNAGGLVGTLDGSCMILRNRVSGTIRGRAGVGGLIGNSFSTHRYVGNEVTATVGSSIERHGAFIGSLATRRLGVYRIKDQREYVLEDIYQGNSWRYTGSGKAPQDVGTSDVKPDARGGLDVAGVDQR